ncbi:hypothetical protein imdm_1456 [gamma proteobacterium IMCC2047]|nr:hypothetical protein imdm_1456 [gamma proteobacterium IMCC2047]
MVFSIPVISIALILMTIGSFALADQSTASWASAIILLFVAIKGYLIADGFMELRGHKRLLRYAMVVYCPLLSVIIWLIVSS